LAQGAGGTATARAILYRHIDETGTAFGFARASVGDPGYRENGHIGWLTSWVVLCREPSFIPWQCWPTAGFRAHVAKNPARRADQALTFGTGRNGCTRRVGKQGLDRHGALGSAPFVSGGCAHRRIPQCNPSAGKIPGFFRYRPGEGRISSMFRTQTGILPKSS